MRTVMIDAPMPVVRRAIEGLRGARLVRVFGKVAVQSPDFEEVETSKLESIVEWMTLGGLPVEVLENQDPLPSECGDPGE